MSFIFIPPVEKKEKVKLQVQKKYFFRKPEDDDCSIKFYKDEPELFGEKVDTLKYWCLADPRIPEDIKNAQLLQFLYAGGGDVKQASELILQHYAFTKQMPELFNDRNPSTNKKIINAWNLIKIATLPKLTPKGYRVFYTSLNSKSKQRYNMILHIKMFHMCVEASLFLEGINKDGYLVVIDTREFPIEFSVIAHQAKVLTFLPYFMEGFQINVISLHLIFYPGFSDRLAYLRNYLTVEMNKKLYFHTCGTADMLKLYEIIPRSCLPKELNGILPDDISLLSDRMKKMIQSLTLYFVAEESQRKGVLQVDDEELKKEGNKDKNDLFDNSNKDARDAYIRRMKEFKSLSKGKRSRNMFRFNDLHLNEMKKRAPAPTQEVKFKPLKVPLSVKENGKVSKCGNNFE